jgi:fructokinase
MRIGIDLGGSKIGGVVLADDGAVVGRRRITAPQGDYSATLDAVAGIVGGLESDAGQTCVVGMGIPGAVSPRTGKVKNANSTWLIGHAIDRDMAKRIDRPVRVANDANCFAVSEASDGAAEGARVVFGVILGTGCGGGLAVDGKVHAGPNAIAGEWGHVPLPWARADEFPGESCYCGKRGCLETWISGTGLARDDGRGLDGAEVHRRAEQGEDRALSVIARYEDRLARALGLAITVLDPDVIVLGGGVSNMPRLYRNIPPILARWVFGGETQTPIRPALHGDASGVRGAAWLWRPDEA